MAKGRPVPPSRPVKQQTNTPSQTPERRTGGPARPNLLQHLGVPFQSLIREQAGWKVYLLGFFLPFLLITIGFAVGGAVFGNKMILAHDQWHQYFPFFLDLQRKLQSGGSLFYSWTGGLGTNYLSLGAYYLASPMNLLIKYLPESAALGYYTFTVMVKIGLAGLFCTICLTKLTDRTELAAAIFGTAYALCTFIMGYYWNAIWLDTVALLPLVTLGAFQLLRDKHFVLYIASLAMAMLCSYYIGFFLCLFMILFFLAYNVCYWDDVGGFFSRLGRMFVFSALALGIAAILLVPAYLGLQTTAAAGSAFPEQFALNMTKKEGLKGVLDALRQTLGNFATGMEPTSMEGLPNVACGAVCLVLAILYSCISKISLREKICAWLLLLFFGVSFAIRQLDYVWHGFHFPNMLPYRFSFLFSFVVVFMAYRAYTKLDRMRWYYVLIALPAVVLWMYCVFTTQEEALVGWLTLLIVLMSLGLILAFGLKKLPKSLLCVGLCVILLVECTVGMTQGMQVVGFTDGATYPKKEEAVSQVVGRMQEREADTVDLWRAEVTMTQTLNDNALNGYRGVSMFSSAINSRVTNFTRSIGMAAYPGANRSIYQEADPFTNLLLNVKYLIDRDGRWIDQAWFEKVDEQDGVNLLENQAYLPLGFMVDPSAAEYDPAQHTADNRFENINALFKAMSGESADLFIDRPHDTTSAKKDTQMTRVADRKYEIQVAEGATNADTMGYVNYRIQKDCQLCVYTYTTDAGNITVYLNDSQQYTYSDKYGYLRYLGEFKAGDKVTVGVSPKSGKNKCTVRFYAAEFNAELFRRAYDKWAAQTMTATKVTDTEIEGTILVQEAGLFYTSVPYESGWTATVDGLPVEVTPVGGAMIAFPLREGRHEIRLYYETPGYSEGKTASIICLAIFLLLVVLFLLKRIFTRPLQKVTVDMEDGAARSALRESAMPADPPPQEEKWEQTMPALEIPKPPQEDPATEWQVPETKAQNEWDIPLDDFEDAPEPPEADLPEEETPPKADPEE